MQPKWVVCKVAAVSRIIVLSVKQNRMVLFTRVCHSSPTHPSLPVLTVNVQPLESR